jgi:hypothetical protein
MFMSLPVLSVALGTAAYKYFSREAGLKSEPESGRASDSEYEHEYEFRRGDRAEVAAVVVEDASGLLTTWIPSLSYLDSHATDVEHIAMALSDAMKATENLIVNYMCSAETKGVIERTINKICLLSPNEREGLCDSEGDGHSD